MGLLRVREWSQEAEGFELLLVRNVALCFVDRLCISEGVSEVDGAKVEMRWATRVVLVRWGLVPGSVGERDERVYRVV